MRVTWLLALIACLVGSPTAASSQPGARSFCGDGPRDLPLVASLMPLVLTAGRTTRTNSLPVQVDAQLPPNVPLRVTNVQVEPSENGLKKFSYTLENLSAHRLVAVAITWEMAFGQRVGPFMTDISDWWVPGGLPTGGAEEFSQGPIAGSGQHLLTRLSAKLDYAEFDDGTRLGARADDLFARLTRQRTGVKAQYAAFLGTYRASGYEALLRSLAGAKTSPEKAARLAAQGA